MNTFYHDPDTSSSLTAGRCKISGSISLEPHYHRQTEFLYVLEGALSVQVNGRSWNIKADQFAVIRSLDVHGFTISAPETRVFLLILPDFYTLNLAELHISSRIFPWQDPQVKQIVEMYQDFSKIHSKFMRHYYGMFFEVIRSLYDPVPRNRISPAAAIAQYIADHYRQPLTLDIVAEACGTNRSYVSRAINDLYGTGFNQYVNRLRISAFLELYANRENTKSIEKLALAVGFSNVRTFYRAFHRNLKRSPGEFLTSTDK